MKLTIEMTDDQARYIISALEMAVNTDYPLSDPWNRKYLRLRDKIKKQAVEQVNRPLAITTSKRDIVAGIMAS